MDINENFENPDLTKDWKRVKTPRVETNFILYRALWAMLVLLVIWYWYMTFSEIDDTTAEAIQTTKKIEIPEDEKSSFTDLTKQDIVKQYEDVVSDLKVHRVKTEINVNDLWNHEQPFKPFVKPWN